MSVKVDYSLWKEVADFFAAIVAPCKECLRGNPVRCWESQCAAFRFRDIARRVANTNTITNISDPPVGRAKKRTPNFHFIYNEIIEKLKAFDRPILPSELQLQTTNSKVKKSHAITRLIKKGIIDEARMPNGSRMILLHTKEPKK